MKIKIWIPHSSSLHFPVVLNFDMMCCSCIDDVWSGRARDMPCVLAAPGNGKCDPQSCKDQCASKYSDSGLCVQSFGNLYSCNCSWPCGKEWNLLKVYDQVYPHWNNSSRFVSLSITIDLLSIDLICNKINEAIIIPLIWILNFIDKYSSFNNFKYLKN